MLICYMNLALHSRPHAQIEGAVSLRPGSYLGCRSLFIAPSHPARVRRSPSPRSLTAISDVIPHPKLARARKSAPFFSMRCALLCEPDLQIGPLFSCSCAPLLPQLLCFDTHATCPVFFSISNFQL